MLFCWQLFVVQVETTYTIFDCARYCAIYEVGFFVKIVGQTEFRVVVLGTNDARCGVAMLGV